MSQPRKAQARLFLYIFDHSVSQSTTKMQKQSAFVLLFIYLLIVRAQKAQYYMKLPRRKVTRTWAEEKRRTTRKIHFTNRLKLLAEDYCRCCRCCACLRFFCKSKSFRRECKYLKTKRTQSHTITTVKINQCKSKRRTAQVNEIAPRRETRDETRRSRQQILSKYK